MQIRGRKRMRSQPNQNNATRRKVLLGFGFCVLVWPSIWDDEHYAIDCHSMMFSLTSSSPSPPRQFKTKLILDFPLGPAVEKAKYFGFANRNSNQGRNRSEWDLLAVQTCDDTTNDHAMLSEMEIYQRKLPSAILSWVQKGRNDGTIYSSMRKLNEPRKNYMH
mmetsp:Transcript_10043/g.23933  ORF Transcript_10043/g.23933 Transcript_10043/m.23933 type:complete len:163 (-) Transcript_10043:1516-2004(-)